VPVCTGVPRDHSRTCVPPAVVTSPKTPQKPDPRSCPAGVPEAAAAACAVWNYQKHNGGGRQIPPKRNRSRGSFDWASIRPHVLPAEPRADGKQKNFWGQGKARLMPMPPQAARISDARADERSDTGVGRAQIYNDEASTKEIGSRARSSEFARRPPSLGRPTARQVTCCGGAIRREQDAKATRQRWHLHASNGVRSRVPSRYKTRHIVAPINHDFAYAQRGISQRSDLWTPRKKKARMAIMAAVRRIPGLGQKQERRWPRACAAARRPAAEGMPHRGAGDRDAPAAASN